MNTLKMAEMIKEGQKAKSNIQGVELIVEKKLGSLFIVGYDGEKPIKTEVIAFTSTVLNLDWELENVEISFKEALEHIKEGRKVKCMFIDEHNNEDVEYYEGIFEAVYFNEIINGKWYLVDE